ncbi:MAG: family 43 glycosylhydrolase [Nocardioides sp.]
MTPARRAATIAPLLVALFATLLSVGPTTSADAATSGRGPGPASAVSWRSAGVLNPLASRVTRGHPKRKGQPLFRHTEFPDPTGIAYRGRYVAIATGSLAPRSIAPSVRGPWRKAGTALARMPRWATGRGIWASDVIAVRNRYLLYFSAPVAGLGPLGRCIGVAVARTPLQKFRPMRHPLTCPRWARTPRASDLVRPPSPSAVAAGVIDPEGFRTRNGQRYLLYRTQGTPSAIRMVRLTSDGTRARRGARSRVLATSKGVVENPVLMQQRKGWVLITSQGYYGTCAYRTTWRRAPNLKGLRQARSRALVTRQSTRLCGPGGADVVGGSMVLLHAWTCRDRSCPAGDLQRARWYGARRSLFAAHLRWDRRGRPHLGRFVRPVKRRHPAQHSSAGTAADPGTGSGLPGPL